MLKLLGKLWRALVMTAAVLLVLLGVVFGAIRTSLPFANEFRSDLEAYISRTLRTPVSIGSMDVEWQGWGPRIRLRDVALIHSNDQADSLTLDELFVNLEIGPQLFAENLQIADIHLEGVQILLQRNADGTLSVRGLQTREESTDPQAPAVAEDAANLSAFMLFARRIDLLNASILLFDVNSGIDYFFPQANIFVENLDDGHTLFAQIVLPSEIGGHIDVNLELAGSAVDPRELRGVSHVRIRDLNLPEVMRHFPEGTVEVPAGVADVSLWGHWHDGRLQRAVSTLEVRDLQLSGRDVPDALRRPWTASHASLSAQWERMETGWDLALSDIQLVRDGQRWASNALRATSRQDESGVMRLIANGEFLPVADAVDLIFALTGIPPDGSGLEQVAGMNPRGELRDWQLALESGSAGFGDFRYAAGLSEIAVSASGDIPGLSGIEGQLRGAGQQLELDLDSANFVFDSQPLFSQTIALNRARGLIGLTLDETGFRLDSEALTLSADAVNLDARVHASLRGDEPLFLDLQADFREGIAVDGLQFLPEGIMDDELVTWLKGSIGGGGVPDGTLLLRGFADDFPYRDHQGVFLVDGQIEQANLKFLPDWPQVSRAVGKLRFERAMMHAEIVSGEIHGSMIEQVRVGIEDVEQPVLEVEGAVRSYWPELIHFAQEGPLTDIFPEWIGDIGATGQARVTTSLRAPLTEDDPLITVSGGIDFDNASIRLPFNNIVANGVAGRVDFSEEGFACEDVRLTVLGESVLLSANSEPRQDGTRSTRVKLDGPMRLSRVLEELALPIDHLVPGKSKWQVELDISSENADEADDGAILVMRSDLRGTRVNLPLPAGKTRDESRALEVRLPVIGPQAYRSWRVVYGDSLQAAVDVPPGDEIPRVAIGFGDSTPVAGNPGLSLGGQVEQIDLLVWHNTILDLAGALVPDSDGAGFGWPIAADLDIRRLDVAGSYVDNTRIVAATLGNDWVFDVASDELSGSARLARPYSVRNPVTVNIARLDADVLRERKEDGESDDDPVLPNQVPPLVATLESMKLWDYGLSDISLLGSPGPRNYHINLGIDSSSSFALAGDIVWSHNPATRSHVTTAKLRMESNDFGIALGDIGKPGLIGEGVGFVDTNIFWNAPAYQPSAQLLQGSITLKINNGRVLNVDAGAGRLVGLLAFQEIPRRLALDFSDALESGMEFKSIAGTLQITDGVGRTELVRLEGPIGVVDINGDIDFVERSYDQNIVVLPRLGATLPVLAVLTGGVVGGLTVFLADSVLKEIGFDVDAIGRRRYTLTGSWSDPLVEEIIEPSPPSVTDEDRQ